MRHGCIVVLGVGNDAHKTSDLVRQSRGLQNVEHWALRLINRTVISQEAPILSQQLDNSKSMAALLEQQLDSFDARQRWDALSALWRQAENGG